MCGVSMVRKSGWWEEWQRKLVTIIHQQKGGHEWTNHERALPAIGLGGDQYSTPRSLTSINQWPGSGMEGLLQQPGMSLHLLT